MVKTPEAEMYLDPAQNSRSGTLAPEGLTQKFSACLPYNSLSIQLFG